MRSIITFLLNQRIYVFAVTGLLICLGALAWNSLEIDAFPDVTNTQVMILTKAPGLAAVDVERRISYPIEHAMVA